MSLRRLRMRIFYKKRLTLSLCLLLTLAGAAGTSPAYAAADYYRVNNATTREITEFVPCKSVTNNSGKNLFIPTKTPGEWASFYNNLPAGVTIGTCGGAPPSCGDGRCNGTETNATCPGDCPPADECSGQPDETECGIRSCDDTNVYRNCVDGKKDGFEDCWVYAGSCSGGTCSGLPLSTTIGPGATCRYGICNTLYSCDNISCPDYQCTTNAQCPPPGGSGVSSDYECGPSTDCQCVKNCVGAGAACSPGPIGQRCCSDAGACGGWPRTCGGTGCPPECKYTDPGTGKTCHGYGDGTPGATCSWGPYGPDCTPEHCD